MTPNEARLRGFTYSSPIYVKISVNVDIIENGNIIYGNSCFIPGTHDQEKLLIEGIEKYLGVAFHVIKLVPGIICLATFRLVSGPILDADANSCGDDVTTDRTFSELAEQVKECVLQLLCFQNH